MKTVQSSPVLSWRAPSFYYYQKDNRWYGYIFAAAIGLLLYFLFVGPIDWTSVLLIVVAAIALYRNANHKPENIKVEIRGDGIAIGNDYTAYSDLSSFHLVDHGEYMTIEFTRKKFGLPLSALLNDQSPDNVRTVAGRYLPEKTIQTTSINDWISRIIRF